MVVIGDLRRWAIFAVNVTTSTRSHVQASGIAESFDGIMRGMDMRAVWVPLSKSEVETGIHDPIVRTLLQVQDFDVVNQALSIVRDEHIEVIR